MATAGLKVSIITVCKNSEQFLASTIESVINQTCKNIEYIIIDGASTDSTCDIIKKYESKISYWLSEPDEGMYHAINKGLAIATGDYILILNSDDMLAANETIAQVSKFIDLSKADYYHGNMIKLNEAGFKKVKLFPVKFKELLLSTHGTFVPHPCFFISKQLNSVLGGYDLKYKYASDYDYILRALSKGNKGKYLDIYISTFRMHAASITASGKIDLERKKILKQNGYNRYSLITRLYFYYSLWIYYKIINLGHGYKK
ncbi:MAG: glycosyltransferase family 2 protein [Ginsengibacter sp.]